MSTSDVVIVGAGPVGVLSALGLARAGVSVTLLERGAGVVESPRAMVYHWSVLEGLADLGVLEDALRIGFTKQDYQYRVLATGERIEWSMAPLEATERFPFNMHLGQNDLARIALEHLSRHANVRVVWNAKAIELVQDDESVTVLTDGPDGRRSHRGRWLIGADGAGSRVREAVGSAFDGITWPERFVATNVRFDFERLGFGQANMVIDPRFGSIVAKIDASGLWRVTYMEDDSLPEQSVAERIPAYFEVLLEGASDYEVEAFSPYRMHQRSASSYRRGRVLLAGDAAHATNPTGGLGLTSGLFDLYALTPALVAVIRGDADEAVLDHYATERRRVFLEVVSPAASENKRLVYSSADPARLESDLAGIRRMVATPELLWQRLNFPSLLRTPPLVADRAG